MLCTKMKHITQFYIYITNSDLEFKTQGLIKVQYVDSSGNLNITSV